jgi:molybdopterin-guanine dinucleotide biosynthesis protein A
MSSEASIVILAGGEGRRIGGGKPARMLAGERLIDRALSWARARSTAVAVAIRHPGQLAGLDAELIVDDPHVAGPLAGLISALEFAGKRDRASMLTIPADMPFLPQDLPQRVAAAIGPASCALASSGGRLHPVCGLWRASAVDRADAYLATGRRSLAGFAEFVGFVAVDWPSEPVDPFFNINTAEDFAEAERRARA